MSKVKVPIFGTVGKAVIFDPQAGARAEAAVAALAAQIAAGTGSNIFHRNLQNLQVGDDHPQYTMWQAPETIVATWNFQAEPDIEGIPLTEFIEDVVGNELVQDSTSISWTYGDTANTLQAHIIDEYVQDLVGAMLLDTTSIDLAYNDGTGQITASIIDEYVQDLVGAMATDSTSIDFTYNDGAGTLTAATINANPTATIGLTAVNGTAATPMRSDGAPALSQAISPTWTGNHTFTPASGNTIVHAGNLRLDVDNLEVQLGASQDLRLYHDGTNSLIRNDTGDLHLQTGTTVGLKVISSVGRVAVPVRLVIGADSNAGPDGATAAFGVNGIASADSVMDFTRFQANGSGPNIVFGKSRGATVGSHTIVQDTDVLGTIGWYGSNGTTFDNAAFMRVVVDGTPGTSNDMPGRFKFFTAPDGSATAVDRFNICANGAIKCVALTADPSGAEDGMVYYNSSTNKLRVRAGGAWVDLH